MNDDHDEAVLEMASGILDPPGVSRSRRRIGMLIPMYLLGCAPMPHEHTKMNHALESDGAILSMLRHAYSQMAGADIDGLMALYEDDAIIQSAGEPPVSGAPAIRRFWSDTFERYRVELVPRVDEEVSLGDVVVVRGGASGSFVTRASGAAMPVEAWFLQIYRRGPDGRLRFWRGANGPKGKGSG